MKLSLFIEQLLHHKKEDLSNQITGTNSTFVLNKNPFDNTLNIFWNGHLLKAGTEFDFILFNKTITTNFIPYVGNSLIVEYFFMDNTNAN